MKWLRVGSVVLALSAVLALAAAAQEPPALSLSDLEALVEEDEQTLPSFDTAQVIDLAALVGFLGLAMVSFFKKSTPLKIATMVVAVEPIPEDWLTRLLNRDQHRRPISVSVVMPRLPSETE